MNKELISNFIRDFCAVGKLRAKSEVRRRLNEILKAQRKEIVEKIEKILTRHSNWKPTCGYESEEEKGYQEGLQAEAGLIEKEIKEELNLITKEDE